MCKFGDVVVINRFKNENGDIISKHSFVVVDDNENYIKGIKYDFVASMMCSFHELNHKKKKLKYEENLLIKENLVSGKFINEKEGYLKADQLYYFDKSLIDYKVIARIDDELLDNLVELILFLHKKNKIKQIFVNLDSEEKITN